MHWVRRPLPAVACAGRRAVRPMSRREGRSLRSGRKPLIGEVGELVVTVPMPSMPIGFWNDPDRTRYLDSYFAIYPGVWRHGDWIKVLPDGGCVIYGRSDATLNRGGVRMGTSEFYRVVERFTEVADSLVVDTGQLGREGRLILYLVPATGKPLDADVIDRIRGAPCGQGCHRGTCPTRSIRCLAYRGPCQVRSSRCRYGGFSLAHRSRLPPTRTRSPIPRYLPISSAGTPKRDRNERRGRAGGLTWAAGH